MKDQTLSLRLPGSIFQWLERARGEMDTSTYIAQLIQERIEQAQRETAERAEWLAEGREQYTEEVCRQTLQINDEFPIHEE